MFAMSAAVRVYLAKDPADMRKSFDGLAALASGALQLDPFSGHLFVFLNTEGQVSIARLVPMEVVPKP